MALITFEGQVVSFAGTDVEFNTTRLAINSGNTDGYAGVWTTADWQDTPDNSRYYPMNEGQ